MNFLFALLISTSIASPLDSIQNLPEIEITASLKQNDQWNAKANTVTTLPLQVIETNRIETHKELSSITPNLYIPDYGSKMTSSIYIRGIGSRMEHPSMGMYIDNIPVMNKNNYDFEFFDIQKINILRGPQGTLYGRNTIGGIIDIKTLSPFNYEGTRIGLSYGKANTIDVRLSTYQRPHTDVGYSLAILHYQTDDFYTNEYNGKKCDGIRSEELRFRLQWKLAPGWQLDNSTKINYVNQDGFAYRLINEESGKVHNVNHNDPCTYTRFSIINGTTLLYINPKFRFSSTTSYQYLNDEMILDQDFTPKSMFTLTQAQKEHVVTQELILKSVEQKKWEWINGLFGFYKHNNMHAPVIFKENGIEELILENANNGIHSVFPDADLLIQEKSFPIESHFKLPAYGISLFHQSVFHLNKWMITAGIRFDYEHTSIDYSNKADIHYRFNLTMPDYKKLSTSMNGLNNMSFYEIMPRLSVLYPFRNGNVYATISRGYKTGGFNTQIFSDILQNKMMNDLMSDLGIYFEDTMNGYDTNKAISYQPEYSWNYEAGSHFHFFNNTLSLNAAAFYINMRNQQLTVFPPGKSTGRLMSNAGHTRNFGIELSTNYHYNNILLTASYGYTDARFIIYSDGNNNYKGKYIPYVPQNTIYLSGSYNFILNKRLIDRMTILLNWQGAGKIYWEESNTYSQNFYGIAGGTLLWNKGKFTATLWTKNMTDTRYNTFYFKSIGNSFVQRGKPFQIGISIEATF